MACLDQYNLHNKEKCECIQGRVAMRFDTKISDEIYTLYSNHKGEAIIIDKRKFKLITINMGEENKSKLINYVLKD